MMCLILNVSRNVPLVGVPLWSWGVYVSVTILSGHAFTIISCLWDGNVAGRDNKVCFISFGSVDCLCSTNGKTYDTLRTTSPGIFKLFYLKAIQKFMASQSTYTNTCTIIISVKYVHNTCNRTKIYCRKRISARFILVVHFFLSESKTSHSNKDIYDKDIDKYIAFTIKSVYYWLP